MRAPSRPQALHHALETRGFEDMPAGFSAKILILRREDGSFETFLPLVRYMRAYPHRSSTWQVTVARGLGLLWDFCIQTKDRGLSARDVFRQFAFHLRSGTFHADGSDPTGLYWPSTTQKRAEEIIRSVEEFGRWCNGETNIVASPIVPAEDPTAPETGEHVAKMIMWSRLNNLSMLQHIRQMHAPDRMSVVADARPAQGNDLESAIFFPPDHAERLLWEGHIRPGYADHPDIFRRYNVRDQLIALLDGWGGLRMSEGLHLWMNDVTQDPADPGHALVVLNHPAESKVSWFDRRAGREVTDVRREYLRQHYGLLPRNEVKRGWYGVGWKGMALDKRCQAIVFWLDPVAGALFLTLYLGYVRFVRAEIMARRPRGKDHPFLFVSEEKNPLTGLVGEPYSRTAYESNHEAAVRRLGLPYGKEHGTTTHGLRHLYGQGMADLAVPPQAIRMGLHHQNLLSQTVYTVPAHAAINKSLRAAQQAIKEGHKPLVDLSSPSTAQVLLRLRQQLANGGPL